MKKNIVLPVLAVWVLLFSGLAEAQQTQPLTVFPYTWETTDIPLYPVDVTNMCSTDVVDTLCEVNQTAGTLTTKDIPYSGTVPYRGTISGEAPYTGTVPYSGSVPYRGSVPYSGSIPFSGSVPYSGMVSYSGESYYSGPLAITASGTAPYTTNVLDHRAVFTYAVTAPSCDESGSGQKTNCCEAKGNSDGSIHLVCFNVVPQENYWESFEYDVYREETVDVPWTYSGTASYDGYVPYSGSVAYNGEASYSGSASFSGSAEYSGMASFSGSAEYSGTVPYNADYSGTTDYSGVSTCEYKEYSPADVIFQEGNVILDCPTQNQVPTQQVTFKALVTQAKVGDVIRLDATGWTPGSSVSYMIMVQHAQPGTGYKNVFVKTKKPVKGQTTPGPDGVFTATSINLKDGTLVDLQDDGYVLDQPGSYRFTFKVWDASGKSAGKIVSRVVTVAE